MMPTAAVYPVRAVYVEVKEPERIVWTEVESGMTTTSTFKELGDSAPKVHIHQTNVPEAIPQPELKPDSRHRWIALPYLERFPADRVLAEWRGYFESRRIEPEETSMLVFESSDGTKIVYDRQGEGPALLLSTALVYRKPAQPELARLLASHFTVYS